MSQFIGLSCFSSKGIFMSYLLICALIVPQCVVSAEPPMPITVPELVQSTITTPNNNILVSGALKFVSHGLVLAASKDDNSKAGLILLEPADLNSHNDYTQLSGKKVHVLGRYFPNEKDNLVGYNGKIVYNSIDADVPIVSLLELIVCPEKFNAKVVSVAGYGKSSHRGSHLFLSRDDADNNVMANMILLQPSKPSLESDDNVDMGKYILVTGTFTAYKPDDVVASKGYISYEAIAPLK